MDDDADNFTLHGHLTPLLNFHDQSLTDLTSQKLQGHILNLKWESTRVDSTNCFKHKHINI